MQFRRLAPCAALCLLLGHKTAAAQSVGQAIPGDAARPAGMESRVLGRRAPIAIHSAASTPAATVFAARDAAERAFNRLERVMRFPAPTPDGTRGGGPELDLYLDARTPFVDVEQDSLEPFAPWDRSAAVVTVNASLTGAALDRAVTEGVAHALLLGLDAHSARSWRIALASSLAGRALATGAELDAVELFQRDPGRALFNGRDDASSRGAALFFDYLSERFDDERATLLRGLAAMPVAHTADDATRLADEPDGFDALRRLVRDERGGINGVLSDFAIARGMAGSSTETLFSVGYREESRLLPAEVRPVLFRELPAWITPQRPTDETGTHFTRIDTTGARDRNLSFWLHGAPWRSWAAIAVSFDSFGHERGRHYFTAAQITTAQMAQGVRQEWLHGELTTTLELAAEDTSVLVAVLDLGNNDLDPDSPIDRNGLFVLNVAAAPAAR